MKSTVINFVRFLTIFIIALMCLTTTCSASENTDSTSSVQQNVAITEASDTEDVQNSQSPMNVKWFYNQLSDMEKVIYDGFANKRESLLDGKEVYIPFASSSFKSSMTTNEFKDLIITAQRAYLADNPVEKIWMDNCKLYLCCKDNLMQIRIKPQGKFDTREATETFEQIATEFVETLSGTDLEKLQAIHNWLTHNVKYDLTAENNGNAYGAIVEGRSVCSGFAYSFKYLADKAGLNVVYVQGYVSTSYYHAWNMAEIDGEWILIDVTFDRSLRNSSLFYWQDSRCHHPDSLFTYPS